MLYIVSILFVVIYIYYNFYMTNFYNTLINITGISSIPEANSIICSKSIESDIGNNNGFFILFFLGYIIFIL